MQPDPQPGRPLAALAISMALACVPATALAGTLQWAGLGTSTLWSDALNWSPQSAPVDGDALVFAGAPARTSSLLDIARSFSALTFSAGAALFTTHVSGGGAQLAFSGAGILSLDATGSSVVRQAFFADAGSTGGTIAFTDWIEGPAGLTDEQAARFLKFMKFPGIQDIAGYCALLAGSGCEVLATEDTGRFAPHVDLYLNMLNMQLTYDALKIIGFDTALMGVMAGEMRFMQTLAREGRIAQGIFVARKK